MAKQMDKPGKAPLSPSPTQPVSSETGAGQEMAAGLGKIGLTKLLDKLRVGSNHPVTEEIIKSPLGQTAILATYMVQPDD
jgi:hypothetical protein